MPIQARNGDSLIVQDYMGRTLVIQDSSGDVVSHVEAGPAGPIFRDTSTGYFTTVFDYSSHPSFSSVYEGRRIRGATSWDSHFYIQSNQNWPVPLRFMADGTADGVISLAGCAGPVKAANGEFWQVGKTAANNIAFGHWLVATGALQAGVITTVTTTTDASSLFLAVNSAELIVKDGANIHVFAHDGTLIRTTTTTVTSSPRDMHYSDVNDHVDMIFTGPNRSVRVSTITGAQLATEFAFDTFPFVRAGFAVGDTHYIILGSASVHRLQPYAVDFS